MPSCNPGGNFEIVTGGRFYDAAALLYLNLGANYSGFENTTRMTWGIGTETRLRDRLICIGEVAGENKGKPVYQAGILTSLISDKIEMDLACGNTFGHSTEDRYIALALRFISPTLFH